MIYLFLSLVWFAMGLCGWALVGTFWLALKVLGFVVWIIRGIFRLVIRVCKTVYVRFKQRNGR